MAIGRVAGNPNYSAGGTSAFIPEVWASKMLSKWYLKTFYNEICNTEYEGDIKGAGDKVYIRTIPDITVSDYSKGMNLAVQRPESADIELTIDYGSYWNIVLDDVDRIQSDLPLLNKWTDDAAQQTKIAIDYKVLNAVYSDVHASNTGATAGAISGAFNVGATSAPVQITKSNVLDYIVDCGTILDEQNVPEESRYMVLPTWMAGLIKKSDLKDASLTGDGSSPLRNGRIGSIDRFTLYSSNQVSYYSTDTAYRALFGHKYAITFATQFVKTESLRAESTFGDIVRGLQVYGFKVIQPKALGMLYCKKG